MNRQSRILAGTAFGLLMASSPSGAISPRGIDGSQIWSSTISNAAPLILAQGEESRGAEVLRKKRAERAARKAAQDAEKAARAGEKAAPAPAEENEKPKKSGKKRESKPVGETQAQPRPIEEPAPRRKRRAIEEGRPAAIDSEPARQAEEAEPAPRAERRPARAKPGKEAEPPRVRNRKAVADQEAMPSNDDDQPEAQPKRQGKKRLFDSDKEKRTSRRNRNDAPAPVDAGPPPEDDREAQEESISRKVRSVTAEDGVRRDRPVERRRRERPQGVEILREIGDRLILQLGDQVVVESNDRPRLSRGAKEVYVEDMADGRTRETIVRPNGTRIITVRNVYGDVIRRSRVTRDGREQILSYVDESDYERVRERRDPGLDLPPIRVDIPEEEYILDAVGVDDPEDYYEFLDQPPVEKVQRLYSVDEVKRSARVRDIARRVDLDTITFEFGSASIVESEVGRLEGVANAMERLLEENPGETFLIEGHTDAVGSDLANLALSDRRAESVAQALTDVFGLPPENFATQGYGEEYLKVDTEGPERENRRVAIRRITALVAPVASAN